MSDDATADAGPRAAPPWPPWLLCLAAGYGFALFAIVTLRSPINHFGTLDPLIYQSYIRDYRGLIDLHGYTYFSSRVAWIAPSAWIQGLLGETVGYYAIRILLLGGAATAFAVMVARFCRWPFAVFAAAWFSFCPFILRGFAHEYVDGPATAYAVMGMACVLTARPKTWWLHALGGAFFALACNTYPMSLIVPATLAAPWFMLRRRAGDEVNIGCILAAAAGFAVAYGLIALFLWHQFAAVGRPFEVIPVSKIRTLASGEAATWLTPLGQLILTSGEYFRAYPLFLLAALLSLAVARRDEWAAVLATLCGGVVATYLALHFGLKSGAIAIPWGYIYALPACGLATIYLLDRLTPQRHLLTVCAVATTVTLATVSAHLMALTLVAPKWLWLMTGVLIALSSLALLRPRLAPLRWAGIVGLLVLPLGFYSASYAGCGFTLGAKPEVRGSYVGCMRMNATVAEWDLRHGIFQLMDDVKNVVPRGSPPGFWYANGSGYADEVESTFLWQYNRIASTEASDPGMPVLNAFARTQLSRYDYLVLIGRDGAQLDTAGAALTAGGYAVRPLLRRRVGGEGFTFTYEILRKVR